MLSQGTDTTPLGLLSLWGFLPRVAAKHGNPGLFAITASRYCIYFSTAIISVCGEIARVYISPRTYRNICFEGSPLNQTIATQAGRRYERSVIC